MLTRQRHKLRRPLVRTEQGSRPCPGFCLALELSDDCVGLFAEQDGHIPPEGIGQLVSNTLLGVSCGPSGGVPLLPDAPLFGLETKGLRVFTASSVRDIAGGPDGAGGSSPHATGNSPKLTRTSLIVRTPDPMAARVG